MVRGPSRRAAAAVMGAVNGSGAAARARLRSACGRGRRAAARGVPGRAEHGGAAVTVRRQVRARINRQRMHHGRAALCIAACAPE